MLQGNVQKIYRLTHKPNCMGVKTLTAIGITAIASLLLIMLGILYFMLGVWIIKIGAGWAGYPDVSGEMVVLTAGIITAASLIGSAIQK